MEVTTLWGCVEIERQRGGPKDEHVSMIRYLWRQTGRQQSSKSTIAGWGGGLGMGDRKEMMSRSGSIPQLWVLHVFGKSQI